MKYFVLKAMRLNMISELIILISNNKNSLLEMIIFLLLLHTSKNHLFHRILMKENLIALLSFKTLTTLTIQF